MAWKKNSSSTKLHLPQREREELLFTISSETFYSQTSGGTESVKKASAGSIPRTKLSCTFGFCCYVVTGNAWWDSEAKPWPALHVAFRSLQKIMLIESSGVGSEESYFRKWVYLPKPEEVPFDFQNKRNHFHGMSRLAWRATFTLFTASKMVTDGNDTWELWH